MTQPSAIVDSALLASAGRDISRNWWLLLLRGLVAITFGVLTFMWPGISLLSMTILWGCYALVDGLLSLGASLFRGETAWGSRWWLALTGVCGVIAGVGAFAYTGMTTFILLMFIAFWAIAVGVLQIVGAVRLRKLIRDEWLLALNGLVSIAFGAVMIVRPNQGALAFAYVIGAYVVISGVMSIALSFKLKRLAGPQD